MTPKTATSLSVLALMLSLSPTAMAQTSTETPSATQQRSSPAAQLPPEKMPAEKVAPAAKSATPADGYITTQNANTVLGTDLIGKTAYGSDQKKIGTINDVIMKQDGSGIEGVVVGIGGFLGLGEHNVALKMDKFTFRPSESGRVMVVLTASKEELQATPAFKSKADQEAEAARNAPRPTTPGGPGTGGTSRAN
ncbi:MAG: PRC-barrel domain-containing protein [Hyphomicrobiaceae bacterium]